MTVQQSSAVIISSSSKNSSSPYSYSAMVKEWESGRETLKAQRSGGGGLGQCRSGAKQRQANAREGRSTRSVRSGGLRSRRRSWCCGVVVAGCERRWRRDGSERDAPQILLQVLSW